MLDMILIDNYALNDRVLNIFDEKNRILLNDIIFSQIILPRLRILFHLPCQYQPSGNPNFYPDVQVLSLKFLKKVNKYNKKNSLLQSSYLIKGHKQWSS